jgi:hypothetical protein
VIFILQVERLCLVHFVKIFETLVDDSLVEGNQNDHYYQYIENVDFRIVLLVLKVPDCWRSTSIRLLLYLTISFILRTMEKRGIVMVIRLIVLVIFNITIESEA